MISIIAPTTWHSYELIDTGGYEKLERFGDYILARPEPQAIWDKSLPETEWQKLADATFKKEKGSQEKGEWICKAHIPERWIMNYKSDNLELSFKIALSSFKHVGLFPEQASNWEYIFQKTQRLPTPKPKVLNLFAYTGLASLAAKAANADISHLDSIKQVVSWAKENMEHSALDNIRWVVEDALTFVKREAKRGNIYQGVVLDPPAYGRGPDGEKWILEEHLNELLRTVAKILDPEHHFVILNLYSLGFSALIVENLMKSHFPTAQNIEFGELYLPDSFQKKLPLGTFYRFGTV